jgi:hypothetical protein
LRENPSSERLLLARPHHDVRPGATQAQQSPGSGSRDTAAVTSTPRQLPTQNWSHRRTETQLLPSEAHGARTTLPLPRAQANSTRRNFRDHRRHINPHRHAVRLAAETQKGFALETWIAQINQSSRPHLRAGRAHCIRNSDRVHLDRH